MNNFFNKILVAIKGWKKLSAFLLGFLTILLRDVIGLDELSTQGIITLVTGYLVGQGIADSGSDRPLNTNIDTTKQ